MSPLKQSFNKRVMVPLQRKKRSKEKLKNRQRMVQFLPNMITVMALCTGLSAIRFALMGNWDFAVIAILLAAVLDAMDGHLARLLGSVTDFGAELDSFSDFISFGVAPSIVIYLFTLHHWKGIGWGVSLFFSTCMALRLARFNVHRLALLTHAPSGAHFFTGVPAPAGAFVALLPLMLSFVFTDFVLYTGVFALFMIATALLMISRLPTFSLKKIHLPYRAMPSALMGVALLAASLFSAPWETLCLIGCLYLCSIPLSVFFARSQRKKDKLSLPISLQKPEEKTH